MNSIKLIIAILILYPALQFAQNYMVHQPIEFDGDDFYRITRTMTMDKIDRRLFSDQGGSEWVRVSNRTDEHDFSIMITSDPGWHRIVYSDYGEYVKSYGDNSGDTQFNRPNGVAKARWTTKSGSNYFVPVYIADSGNNRIVELTMVMIIIPGFGKQSYLQYRREFTGIGSSAGAFSYPMDVAYQHVGSSQNPDDGYLWVTDTGNHRIVRIRLSDGQITGTWGSYGSGNGKFIYPSRLAIGKEGTALDVYVVDSGNQRIAKFKPIEQQGDTKIRSVDPTMSWQDETPFNGRFYYGLYSDAFGYIWAVDGMNHALVHFDENLDMLFAHGDYGIGQTPNKLNRPTDAYRFYRNIFENNSQFIEYTDVSHVTEEWTEGSGQLQFSSTPKMMANTFSYAHVYDEDGCSGGGVRPPVLTIHPPCDWVGTNFTFKTSDACRLTAVIKDKNNQSTVKTLFSNQLTLPGNVTVNWNGKDSEGQRYDDCNYYIHLTFKSLYIANTPGITNVINIPVGCVGSKNIPKLAGDGDLPQTFEVFPNYPNPFNGVTQLRYQLPQQGKVKITVYNILGQQVKTLVNGVQDAGVYTVPWQGVDDAGNTVASGVYFLRVTFAVENNINYSFIKKALLIK